MDISRTPFIAQTNDSNSSSASSHDLLPIGHSPLYRAPIKPTSRQKSLEKFETYFEQSPNPRGPHAPLFQHSLESPFVPQYSDGRTPRKPHTVPASSEVRREICMHYEDILNCLQDKHMEMNFRSAKDKKKVEKMIIKAVKSSDRAVQVKKLAKLINKTTPSAQVATATMPFSDVYSRIAAASKVIIHDNGVYPPETWVCIPDPDRGNGKWQRFRPDMPYDRKPCDSPDEILKQQQAKNQSRTANVLSYRTSHVVSSDTRSIQSFSTSRSKPYQFETAISKLHSRRKARHSVASEPGKSQELALSRTASLHIDENDKKKNRNSIVEQPDPIQQDEQDDTIKNPQETTRLKNKPSKPSPRIAASPFSFPSIRVPKLSFVPHLFSTKKSSDIQPLAFDDADEETKAGEKEAEQLTPSAVKKFRRQQYLEAAERYEAEFETCVERKMIKDPTKAGFQAKLIKCYDSYLQARHGSKFSEPERDLSICDKLLNCVRERGKLLGTEVSADHKHEILKRRIGILEELTGNQPDVSQEDIRAYLKQIEEAAEQIVDEKATLSKPRDNDELVTYLRKLKKAQADLGETKAQRYVQTLNKLAEALQHSQGIASLLDSTEPEDLLREAQDIEQELGKGPTQQTH